MMRLPPPERTVHERERRKRAERIAALRERGYTLREIAKFEHISIARVHQLVSPTYRRKK